MIYYFLESFLTEIKDAIRDKGNMSPTEEIPTEEIPDYIENLPSTGGLIVSLSETTVGNITISETIAGNMTIIEPL